VTPSWYDLLGVAPDAPVDEIRSAWKAAIADLDPTDRRFRVLNEAAEVLLDPTSRAAYDATVEALVEPVEPVEPLVEPVEPLVEPVETTAASTPAQPGRSIPGWVLGVLAALTAVMVGVAAWLATQPSDDSIADATSDAQAAAESAVVTILAYDYRTLEEDQAAAGALMTEDYREEYDKLFASVGQNAVDLKAVVTVDEPLASGIVRAGEGRVQVLLFVDRPTKNAERNAVFQDQVTMTMEKEGDTWLVDGLETSPLQP
jgi:Mce-associated membrane protein